MVRKYVSRLGLVITLGVILSSVSIAASSREEDRLPVLSTKAETIAIFKNGLGFFIREGEVSLQDGWAVLEYVPNSTLGSVWVRSLDEGVTLEEVIAFKEETEDETEAISIEELLKANIGKEAVIASGDTTIEGRISSVPEDRQGEEDTVLSDYRGSYVPPRTQPELATIVIVDTADGKVALNRNTISRVQFPEASTTAFLRKGQAKRIRLRVSGQRESARLGLSYLQKGISWVPSYLINIEDPATARVTLKATVTNDVEDVENADVFFVVGYPNFVYADILSPMALEESVAQFMASLEAGGRRAEEYSRLANIMSQSVTFAEASGERTPPLDYSYAAIRGLPGASEEDLFLYHKEGVSLGKGERAYYHVFSDEVEYEHVYEWEIPDTIRVDVRGYYRSEQERSEREQVWHSIKLTNSTEYPWTTAPALVISGWKPLSQDTIEYTPKGTETNLRLTVATDVQSDRHEYEVERQRGVMLNRRSFDLVTVQGELYIKNCKAKDVTMELKKSLTGDVIEVSHDGKTARVAEGLRGVNYNSVILWEIPLEAGEEVTVTYKYEVYVTA